MVLFKTYQLGTFRRQKNIKCVQKLAKSRGHALFFALSHFVTKYFMSQSFEGVFALAKLDLSFIILY